MRHRRPAPAPAEGALRLGWVGKTPADLVREVLAADFLLIQAWLSREARGDADAATEVMAAFCLRALTRAGQVREAGSVRPWLARLLRSTLADHWRQQGMARRTQSLDATPAVADSLMVAPQLVSPERRNAAACECLTAMLATMPLHQAELIRRVDLAGESRGRAATRLGVGRTALRVRLHRARNDLRGRLRALCDGCLATVDPAPCDCPLPGAGAL